MKNKLLALLLVVAMLFSVTSVLTACNDTPGGETPGGDNGGNGETPGGGTGDGTGGGNGDGENQTANYKITVKDAGGKAMNGVGYIVYTDETMMIPVTAGSFNQSGEATFTAAPSDKYVVNIFGAPKGYNLAPYYPLSYNTSIVLTPSVIPDKDISGVSYKVGDIMHDFTLTDIDGNVHTLSEILKEKDAVMLNFWFTTCGPCASEFPHMASSYSTPFTEGGTEAYKDSIEIIAIAPQYMDSNLQNVIDYRDSYELPFPVVWYQSTALIEAFNVGNYPTSVFIDRYGTICLIEVGALTSQRPFDAAFAHFTSDNYQQQLFDSIGDLVPVELPDVEMPESSEIEAILNGANEATDDESDKMGATYAPETQPGSAEYSWPFLIGNKDGYDCIYASNSKKEASFSMLYSYVELKAGEALAIDYYASTENGSDCLFIIVDGKDVLMISGDSSDEGWTTCYPYVATEDGTYEVVFTYIKDDSVDFGEDTVYLKDYRIVSADKVTRETYIPRFAATELSSNNTTYENYVAIVYNEDDGYYHVGGVNGPILLVNLLSPTRFSNSSIQTIVSSNEILVDGVNISGTVMSYCNYASNSALLGYTPVTAELYECLVAIATEVGLGQFFGIAPEVDFLSMCEYYDAYGTNGRQFEDPIKGLANFSAYDVILNAPDDSATFPNKFKYNRIIMPRGLRAEFTPEESGVYLIVSKSDYETDAWIFLENGSQYLAYENNDRHAKDYNNCYVLAYFEAGVSYYIDIAFYDVTQFGDVYYNVRRIGDAGYDNGNGEYYRFGRASDTAYTYDPTDFRCPTCGNRLTNIVSSNPETGTGKGMCSTCDNETTGNLSYELIDGGIKVKYDPVTDRYYEVMTDGSTREGGMLYVDFWLDMGVFGEGSNLISVLNRGGFNFTRDEDGGAVSGVDYTDRVREIIDELLIDEGVEGELDYATDGCVPVTRELAGILQMLMDKYTFKIYTPGDDYELGSWKKLSYRFEYFGPENVPVPKTFDE